ncbi:MAG TPA: hypothetical protein PLI13_07040 [Paracoccus sp. (in: a-proteobacteria)]|nr:hypothetical protein [Paracoccus sp. (in: a-proteobacteria)]
MHSILDSDDELPGLPPDRHGDRLPCHGISGGEPGFEKGLRLLQYVGKIVLEPFDDTARDRVVVVDDGDPCR